MGWTLHNSHTWINELELSSHKPDKFAIITIETNFQLIEALIIDTTRYVTKHSNTDIWMYSMTFRPLLKCNLFQLIILAKFSLMSGVNSCRILINSWILHFRSYIWFPGLSYFKCFFNLWSAMQNLFDV